MPSAICYEQVAPGEWKEHFCLVNPTRRFEDEDEASQTAEADLHEALAVKSRTGADAELALCLKSKGYLRVDDFQRAKG